jgi:predicted transposase/invertase (TIGR01784 family)
MEDILKKYIEERVPPALKESIFEKVFKTAEIAKFTLKEHQHYIDSLKYYRDLKNSLDTAKEEGRKEGEQIGIQKGEQIGIQKAKIEMAKNAKKIGMPTQDVSDLTGLNSDEIEKL